MKIGIKGVILAMSALAIAGIAMAAKAPKVSIDTDNKDSRIVNVTVTAPDGTVNFHCQYGWQITFKNGAETTDTCEVDIPAGTKNAVVCTRQYDTKVSQTVLVQRVCKPT